MDAHRLRLTSLLSITGLYVLRGMLAWQIFRIKQNARTFDIEFGGGIVSMKINVKAGISYDGSLSGVDLFSKC